MKLSDLKKNDEIVAELARSDPEFRAEWERTATARALAVALVRHRADHGLAQEGLAEVLGLPIVEYARLEWGEFMPPDDLLAGLPDLPREVSAVRCMSRTGLRDDV